MCIEAGINKQYNEFLVIHVGLISRFLLVVVFLPIPHFKNVSHFPCKIGTHIYSAYYNICCYGRLRRINAI